MRRERLVARRSSLIAAIVLGGVCLAAPLLTFRPASSVPSSAATIATPPDMSDWSIEQVKIWIAEHPQEWWEWQENESCQWLAANPYVPSCVYFPPMRNVPVHPWVLEGLPVARAYTVWLSGEDLQRLIDHHIPPAQAASIRPYFLNDTFITRFQFPNGAWSSVAWGEWEERIP